MDKEGMLNARLGVVYLWQGTKMHSGLASTIVSGTFNAVANFTSIPSDINVHSHAVVGDIADAGVHSGTGGEDSLFRKLKAWAEDFIRNIWKKMKASFGVVEVLGGIKNLAIYIAKSVSKAAAPFIGAGVDMVSGLWKGTSALVEKISLHMAKGDTKIVFGHPKTLVEGINRGLTMAMLEGIYELAKGTISTILNSLTAGAAAIIDACAAAIEAVIKIIWRYCEWKRVQEFCEKAKWLWATRGDKNPAYASSRKFNAWLQPITEAVPLVAAVTLGTGIAGDKMRFLEMYTDSGKTITKSQFADGVRYLDKVKRAGSRMLERSDIEFSSSDPVLAGLLELAKSHDAVNVASKGRFRRLFSKIDKIVRA